MGCYMRLIGLIINQIGLIVGLRGVLWGYYIYGRDSVIIFDMGIYVGE